jgi:hypothetical protein
VALAVATILGSLIALALLLWTVHRLKPARFRLKASITKWVSLDVQMEASPASHRDPARRIARSTDGPDTGPVKRARQAHADEPHGHLGPGD